MYNYNYIKLDCLGIYIIKKYNKIYCILLIYICFVLYDNDIIFF